MPIDRRRSRLRPKRYDILVEPKAMVTFKKDEENEKNDMGV